MASPRRQPHLKAQSRYFDSRADIFVKPIPEQIQERTRSIVRAAHLDATSKVLDVGTGAGVLIAHFLEFGVEETNIVGCDLSTAMLANAKERYPDVFFWQGDVAELSLPLPEAFPSRIGSFDAVFFNACFGNMWDQEETLQAAIGLLGGDGRVVISHPLGNRFVLSLHKSDPEIVPHLMPSRKLLDEWSPRLGFFVERYEDEEDFYLSVLRCRGAADSETDSD